VTGVFDGIGLTRPLWPHQVRALAALDRDVARGDRATYLVVPPGGGKTLIGLEAARRLGRPTVVLCPNTAIQAQWMAQWQASFGPDAVPATASRELPAPLTVLTYQALCTLGAAGNGEEEAGRPSPRTRLAADGVLSLLHPNGRALIARLQAGGPWTLVLDECHHLLELWGRLLQAVIGQLDKPRVVGLTATPPHLMTAEQAVLHRALFGGVDLEVSAPALVREGLLAPYQELAFLTRPSPAEADYIHGESLRFAELRAGLLDPGFASVPFLGWLQARAVERRGASGTEGDGGAQVSWTRFEKDEPALADAAVRLHVAGLLDLPEGARVREQHRHPPTAADWVALIGDYTQRCLLASEDPRDERALGAIRRALPAVGYRLTRAGVRAGESPVDRVLARSESKARAAIEILAAESAELGSRLRALVLCDYEDAGGMVPADLAGVLPSGSGGARLVLETLLADPQAAALDPVLLTGRHVACGPECAERLLKWLREAGPGLELAVAPWGDLAEITGAAGWEPRRYVPLVTRFHAEGGSCCLIGTRALLGEGWDAPAVNVVIDLTAATTPTSVVQARGRAERQQEAGHRVRAGVERPRRPRRRALDRVARGHRHPGRPARRRSVRGHDPDPDPVAVTTRSSHSARTWRSPSLSIVRPGSSARRAFATGMGPVVRGAGPAIVMAATSASNMASERSGVRCAGGVASRVITVPQPAACTMSAARRSLTLSRPDAAMLWIRACRTVNAAAAAGGVRPGLGSPYMSRNSAGFSRPKDACRSQPARRSSTGSAPGSGTGLAAR
jgi:superfamily II DNA or RNA helicase